MTSEELAEMKRKTGYREPQKVTTYYKTNEKEAEGLKHHKERREQNREIRETQRDKSTPLGFFEKHIFGGNTPITTGGRHVVEAARTKKREVGERVTKKVEPTRRAIAPFAVDIATMMRAPEIRTPIYNKKGKRTGTKVTHEQPSPLSNMAPINMYVPDFMRGPSEPRTKKGKKRIVKEPGGDIWSGMMEVPEGVRRWM
jgi:hypothetical protein